MCGLRAVSGEREDKYRSHEPKRNGARSRMIASGTKIAGRSCCRPGLLMGLLWVVTAGCSQSNECLEQERVAQPLDTLIAVAPALDFSGSAQFDPVQVGDLMASELSERPGIGVIGVSRVLAVLAQQGVDGIQSPSHALQVCETLGADAIVVFAVTEYDAYTPIVGLAAQLYGPRKQESSFDPVATSRMARPFPVVSGQEQLRPWAQTQRTFHAEHDDVRCDVRRYAKTRSASEGPYGWKKYLASQTWYLRFCCNAVIADLMQLSARKPMSEPVAPPAVAKGSSQEERG